MHRHRYAAVRCTVALISILTAAGISVAQEAERTAFDGRAVSETCLADPKACLEQKRGEFEARGTLGLDLHPKKDGDTIMWTVHRLDAGAAAEEGGLEPGDILLHWNGELPSTSENPDRLKSLVTELRVGDEVELQVMRGLEQRTFTLTARAPDRRTIQLWLWYFAKQHFDGIPAAEEYLREAEQRLLEHEAGG